MIEVPYIEPVLSKKSSSVFAFFTLKEDRFFNNKGYGAALRKPTELNISNEILKKRRSILFSALNLDEAWTAWAHQVHGSSVKVVSQGGLYGDVDALVTTVPGLSLIIQVADCAAVLLADESNNSIAAAHAGWRGAAGNIIPNTVNMMQQQGADPQSTYAYISPCISQKNFEVGEEVAEQFPDVFVDRKSYIKPHVDLKAFIQKQLVDAGLKPTHVEVDTRCTMDKSRLLYSYRREKEQSGRMLAVIKLDTGA